LPTEISCENERLQTKRVQASNDQKIVASPTFKEVFAFAEPALEK
jgi:hypothetical protein